ncbi:tetratricopeptide repeat protein [Actinomadura sp. WMMA1423]|uniref:tetratricopeptide repeat protein n=1 Tax=Actinomadura sp. WMMA1423 TaxID=2591108 RepID=UPI00197AF7F3|nr:tetratricopeptide repeat protein [Actinomadura sp. WMMA1423]
MRLEGTASGHSQLNQAGRDLNINNSTVLPPEAVRPVSEVAAPPGLVNVPGHRQVFVGRGDELDELDAALRAPGGVVVAAVHGLGGVGKSTLAARYAGTHAARAAHPAAEARVGLGEAVFDPVWWITADTAAAVQAGLAGLAAALQPELRTALELEALAERGLAWLGCHSGWLVVLDNLTDPGHIAPLLDRTMRGRVLVTSRLGQGWHRYGARVLRLDVLTEEQAIDLLTQIAAPERAAAGSGGAGLDGAAELVAELGCLPLAVEQAAAYLLQNQLSPRGYLDLLAASPAVMYHQAAEGSPTGTAGDAGSDARTIARIWRITLDRITADTPLAGELLRVLAWYAPEAVPRTLLDGLAGLEGWQENAAPPLLQAALGKLAAYNMITLTPDTVTVHRLVQAVARTPDTHRPVEDRDPHRGPEAITAARHTATRLLNQTRPADVVDPGGWPRWRQLLPHIDALAAHTPSSTDDTWLSLLLDRAAAFLQNQGLLTRAIAYFERALATAQRLRGPDHPHSLTSRNNLAGVYKAAGDLGRAIPMYEQTLTDRERVLGADHPSTLTSRNNLAGVYKAAGDLGRAIPMYEQTLTDRERVLGADHPSTLTSRNNLAYAYSEVGDLGRAISMYEQTLTDCERVLGADHPSTLTSRNNLAYAYSEVGDLGRAISMYEQTLTDCERVLGADHPSTLTSRNNLAGVYEAAGDLGRAISLLEQTLTDRERVLGADHPSTLTSCNNLAGVYKAAGDLGRAISMYEQTLTDRERVLGADHPDTLTSRNNLAYAYNEVGDLGRAISMYEQTLTDRERVLGADHPDALTSRNNLAGAYEAAGDLGRAISMYEQTLTDCERVLGADHPSTLTSRNNLASAYQTAGDLGRAISMYEQTLTDRERVLGADHPDTLTSRNNLAYAYNEVGDLGRAISMYEQTLTDRERVLGADHPDTLTSRNNLAGVYEAAGDLGRAISMYEQTLIDCERVLGADHPTTGIVRSNLRAVTEP